MDEPASGTVRTGAMGGEGAAHFGLVLGMTRHWTQFFLAMGELALVSIPAASCFFEGTTELCFVEVVPRRWTATLSFAAVHRVPPRHAAGGAAGLLASRPHLLAFSAPFRLPMRRGIAPCRRLMRHPRRRATGHDDGASPPIHATEPDADEDREGKETRPPRRMVQADRVCEDEVRVPSRPGGESSATWFDEGILCGTWFFGPLEGATPDRPSALVSNPFPLQ